MNLDLAPVTLSTPAGILEPVRVTVNDDGYLGVFDRDGNLLTTDVVLSSSGGRRTTTLVAEGGTYVARTLCGCNSRMRELQRLWEFGETVPRRSGT